MRLITLVVLSALMLAACEGSVVRTTVEEEATAKTFAPPAPSMAALYIYRAGHYAWAWPVEVTVVGAVNTRFPVDTFVRVEVPSGPTEVNCLTNARSDHQRREVMADQIRYFQVTLYRGDYGPYCLVSEVAPEVGQAFVRADRRIQSMSP